ETDSADVDLVIDLWEEVRDGIRSDRTFFMPKHCAVTGAQSRGEPGNRVYADANGHIRSWMAVVTYLLLQPEFIQR
ncbi:MAG: hypothetical protein VX589_00450, partial [Myxococcota bacterium]|nr:hypothetical protein [Myxococcota bacterium]